VARGRRGWATSGTWLQLGVPVLDWDAWFGPRDRRQAAAAAAQRQHGRDDAKSGEGEGPAGQHVSMEPSGCPRGAARRVGWLGV
jgi:hypothetical protein